MTASLRSGNQDSTVEALDCSLFKNIAVRPALERWAYTRGFAKKIPPGLVQTSARGAALRPSRHEQRHGAAPSSQTWVRPADIVPDAARILRAPRKAGLTLPARPPGEVALALRPPSYGANSPRRSPMQASGFFVRNPVSRPSPCHAGAVFLAWLAALGAVGALSTWGAGRTSLETRSNSPLQISQRRLTRLL